MSFNEFFLLLCFVQSILLAVSLFSLTKNKLPNRLLALHSLVWGAMCYYRFTVFQNADYILAHHYILKFNNVIFLLVFVFSFLYVKYMSMQYLRFKKRDLLHFLPALLALLLLCPFFFLSGEEKIELLIKHDNPYFRMVHLIIDNIAIVQGVVYSVYSLKYINLYHNRVKDDFSNIEHLTMYWLRNIMILISGTWLLGALGSNLYAFKLINDSYFDVLFYIVGGSIFLIFYYLFVERELFVTDRPVEEHLNTLSNVNCSADLEVDNAVDREKRELQLDALYCEEIISKLTRLMEVDKMYLNQNLSLNEVSQAIKIPRYHISLVLNNKLNNTFFDYINKYRVEEVKRMINDSQWDNLTLLAIAFDAGFNSKASFNRSFKKYENKTPVEYKNSQVSN